MASLLAWLDFSERDQRRARELIQLFLQQESRDELGIGTVRDALSDLMFPGISVIQTRARYFLFVPWLFKEGTRKGRRGRDLLNWVERWQRTHVETLRKSDALDGLIGRIAGARVKILPSTIYWNALQRFGILRFNGSQETIAAVNLHRFEPDDAFDDEHARGDRLWQATLPAPPPGFPDVQELNFELTTDEADWLSERIQDATEGTPLAWLASLSEIPTGECPWEDPLFEKAPKAMKQLLLHAELFSLSMHGAALLYNLLLARRCQELGNERGESLANGYQQDMKDWAEEVDSRQEALNNWDRSDMWNLIKAQSPQIKPQTYSFIESWCGSGVLGAPLKTLDEPRLSEMLKRREREQKKGQARLFNDRLLNQWGGASGSGRLIYRWERVKSILGDIARGKTSAHP
jgi:hypothetical protein